MTRTTNRPDRDEATAWHRLAELRLANLNVHRRITVGHYNERFGTTCETWAEVHADLEKNYVPLHWRRR